MSYHTIRFNPSTREPAADSSARASGGGARGDVTSGSGVPGQPRPPPLQDPGPGGPAEVGAGGSCCFRSRGSREAARCCGRRREAAVRRVRFNRHREARSSRITECAEVRSGRRALPRALVQVTPAPRMAGGRRPKVERRCRISRPCCDPPHRLYTTNSAASLGGWSRAHGVAEAGGSWVVR